MNALQRNVFAPVPQSEPLDDRQIKNSAGGYVYQLDKWAALKRFLILGTEGGTYYASEREHTLGNVASLDACIGEDAMKALQIVTEVSMDGRAPKVDYCLFALARIISKSRLPTAELLIPFAEVVRTGSHLFQFLEFAKGMRGWGRRLRALVGYWYTSKSKEDLAYQLVKYRNRNGWTHRDVLRCCHVGLDSPDVAWAVNGHKDGFILSSDADRRLEVFLLAQLTTGVGETCNLIREARLTHEMVPTPMLASPEVWEALLESMPLTAMIRNLGRMTANGLLAPSSEAAAEVCRRLSDEDAIRKSRVHPIQILAALLTYQAGHGARGALLWEPVQTVVDALDAAFYLAFDNVERSGKTHMLALDVSGSMGSGKIAGIPGLTPRLTSVAMALVTARKEPYVLVGFSHNLVQLPISASDSLWTAMEKVSNIPFGATDCALPWIEAERQGLKVDVVVVLTDNETWCGQVHPKKALARYRGKINPEARQVVVGMTATGFTIADPADPLSLDVVGFDTSTPQLIADFAAGRL